jgi:shikimate 5-dehydrogenase
MLYSGEQARRGDVPTRRGRLQVNDYRPATRPTLYFIGVTTASSSIMKVIPAWAAHLGLSDAEIRGGDFPLNASPAAYREAVSFIKADPLSRGALVTTHKIDLFRACRSQFDEVRPLAKQLGETSCLYKRGPRLLCDAKDPISSGYALDALLPPRHFERTGADVFVIGAGGASVAITWCLLHPDRGDDVPPRVVISDLSAARLEEIQRVHRELGTRTVVDYVLAAKPEDNDEVLAGLRPGSLVINATGLGKDRPGSPVSEVALFPRGGYVWELNYRGALVFLDQARRQEAERQLRIADGWVYFVHGWTQVIAEVFEIEIPTSGPDFDEILAIARRATET